MIAFVVSVNGQRVCAIGIGDKGVLTTHVCWVGEPGEADRLDLGVGGLDSRTDEHVRWPDPPNIRVGDTITIQIVETDAVDPPTARKTPAQLREDERAFLEEIESDRRARFAAEGCPLPEDINPTPPPQRPLTRDPDDELPPFAAPWEQP